MQLHQQDVVGIMSHYFSPVRESSIQCMLIIIRYRIAPKQQRKYSFKTNLLRRLCIVMHSFLRYSSSVRKRQAYSERDKLEYLCWDFTDSILFGLHKLSELFAFTFYINFNHHRHHQPEDITATQNRSPQSDNLHPLVARNSHDVDVVTFKNRLT